MPGHDEHDDQSEQVWLWLQVRKEARRIIKDHMAENVAFIQVCYLYYSVTTGCSQEENLNKETKVSFVKLCCKYFFTTLSYFVTPLVSPGQAGYRRTSANKQSSWSGGDLLSYLPPSLLTLVTLVASKCSPIPQNNDRWPASEEFMEGWINQVTM